MTKKEGNLIIKWRGKELFHILHEVHRKGCTCSYCGDWGKRGGRIHYGLNLPENRNWNSWRVIKYFKRRYIRWTNSYLYE